MTLELLGFVDLSLRLFSVLVMVLFFCGFENVTCGDYFSFLQGLFLIFPVMLLAQNFNPISDTYLFCNATRRVFWMYCILLFRMIV